jgi:hypothetical protein
MASPDKTANPAPIKASVKAYEDWMRAKLGPLLVEEDLDKKHQKMRDSAFVFLRATFWRWVEMMPGVCPELITAPQVLAVGDLHVENYGTWRDAEGRLVWGINDFDEAFEMPYALDLLRLATSALLASDGDAGAKGVANAILDGYRKGLAAPEPVVLDRGWQWLRELVVVSEDARAKFWKKLEAALAEAKPHVPPAAFRSALSTSFPEQGLAFAMAPRTAGAGSLGRPRWVGAAMWKGAPALREAKALLPSAWTLFNTGTNPQLRCGEAATGQYRSIDPWYRVEGNLVIRRLSPNNRKLDSDKEKGPLLSKDMLSAMGLEIANIHAATKGAQAVIMADLQNRPSDWLATAAKAAAKATEADHREWAR